MTIDHVIVLVVLFTALAAMVVIVVRKRRPPTMAASSRPELRGDAYFRAMFPELQPWFHPENVVRFVRDRNGRKNIVDGRTWNDPPGFATAAAAVVVLAGGRERIRILDSAGKTMVEFDYERQDGGAAIRVGGGKLTADLNQGTNVRVRYWHPEREFKWSRKGGWQFKTPVAEQAFDTSPSGSSYASGFDSSSSRDHDFRPEFKSEGGGDFGGGGASEAWGGEAGGSSESSSGGGAGATAY
jgi:uncharacterized membrane protein YgcG